MRGTISGLGYFLFAGAASYLGYVATFYAMRSAGDFSALSSAYAVSVVIHFTLNKALAFRDSRSVDLPMLYRYATLVAVNYAVSTFVGFALVKSGTWPVVAIALGTAATTATGFLMARNWVFKT